MKKKALSILLVLLVLLGTFSTVFADDYDLMHKSDGVTIKLRELLFNISKFNEVVNNQDDYIVEWKNSNYNLKDVQEKFDADEDATMDTAVIGLTPIGEEKYYTVTFQAGANGSLTGKKVFQNIPDGTSWNEAIAVPTPLADTRYVFNGWTPSSFPTTVTRNLTITANFKRKST